MLKPANQNRMNGSIQDVMFVILLADDKKLAVGDKEA